jgi:uncharacterized membrane protein
MSPATLAWIHRLAILGHIAAVVLWFGAVAYYLLILRPALRMSGIERQAQYALLRAVRSRLKRVVGAAVVLLVVTGLLLAWMRGFLGGSVSPSALHMRLFHAKLGIGALLVLIFLTALPMLARVEPPKRRGRLFVLVHMIVLALGTVAAALGVALSR